MHAFQLKTHERQYKFYAPSSAALSEWLGALSSLSVFGVELSRLAKRRAFTQDRGVPLIVSKCIAFVDTHGLKEPNVYKNRNLDESQLSDLRKRFNADDTLVNLHEVRPDMVHEVAATLLAFFEELPISLIPASNAIRFIEALKISNPRDRISALRDLIHALPEAHSLTLKRLCSHLARVAGFSQISGMTAHELAKVFGPPISRITTADASCLDPTVGASWQTARVILVELLIERYEVYFGGAGPHGGATPSQASTLGSGELSAGDTWTSGTSGSVAGSLNVDDEMKTALKKLMQASGRVDEASPFILEFFIDDGNSVYTTAVNMRHQAREVCENLNKILLANHPQKDLQDYSLFEMASSAERIIDDDERVLPVTMRWPPGAQNRLLYKRNPAAKITVPMLAGFPTLSGWLHKEGVSVRSWKKRYFSLKRDAIYYYKDPKMITVIGTLSYHDCNIFSVYDRKKAPTKFGFCLRPTSRNAVFDPNGDVEAPTEERYLCADDQDSRLLWITAIHCAKRLLLPASASSSARGSIFTSAEDVTAKRSDNPGDQDGWSYPKQYVPLKS
jgi:hypothetical protein